MPLSQSWFLIGIVVVMLIALAAPGVAAPSGPLHLGRWNDVLFVAIFLITGIGLPTDRLTAALGSWRQHLMTQGISLVALPLLGIGVYALLGSMQVADAWRIGVLLTCCLPTTISSCVLLTRLAGGSEAVATTQATIGGLLGLVLTPLWLLVGAGLHATTDVPAAVLHLLLIVALPVAVGQALRRWIPGVLRWRRWLTECSTIALLINLHQAFCLGFSAHGAPGWDVPALGLAMGALHLLIWGGCWAAAGLSWLGGQQHGPQRDQRIAMAFCASHKSAALGVPMAGILLRDDPQLGLVLLPVVAYHLAENLLGGVIAARLRRVAPKGGPPGSFPGPPA